LIFAIGGPQTNRRGEEHSINIAQNRGLFFTIIPHYTKFTLQGLLHWTGLASYIFHGQITVDDDLGSREEKGNSGLKDQVNMNETSVGNGSTI